MDKAVAAWLLWEAGGFVILAFVFKGSLMHLARTSWQWVLAWLRH